jgi:biotin carboxylase
MSKNIFVIGLEEFNLRLLRKVRHAENYTFHGLLDYESVAINPKDDVNTLLARACETLDAFPGTIDAIVGYWDFPTILMSPILRRRYGLRGPTLESVLRCEHKYWARAVQKETLPETVPPFALVDPFAADAAAKPPLPYPFWIKPVKAHSSMLGFRVRNASDYRAALEATRAGIRRFAVNLNQIMEHADLPAEIASADGWKCIAEGMISAGRQCTLEGYVFEGMPEVYGIVDSIRGPNRSSFERYQYPSTLPKAVQRRMIDAAKLLITQTGLDNSPFNMEFYWNRQTDRIWILEINARISKSHSPVFEKVEGVPHKEVMIDVALGRRPEYPLGLGQFRHAAKFMLRRYDGNDEQVVLNAPDFDDVRAIERRFPGCEVTLHIREGMRLGDVHLKDSYSYELADVFVGADSQRALMRTYRAIVDELNIEIGAAP